MRYKIDYREEDFILIDAEDPIEAENQFSLQHNPKNNRRVLDVNPVAINGNGEIFELRELVRVPDDESGTDFWRIAAIYEDTVLCIQMDDKRKITSEQEVPCSILMKATQL